MKKKWVALLLTLGVIFSLEPVAVAAPSTGTAYASTQNVTINGTTMEFQAYALKDENGYDTNYVKIRDVALALDGTTAQFNVGWDGAVNLETGKPYTTRNGQENQTPYTGDRPYTNATAATKVNGVVADLDAFILLDDNGGASTYYKLRDLGQALGFAVDWTAEQGIYIETGEGLSYYELCPTVVDFGEMIHSSPITVKGPEKYDDGTENVLYAYDPTQFTTDDLNRYIQQLRADGFSDVEKGDMPDAIFAGIDSDSTIVFVLTTGIISVDQYVWLSKRNNNSYTSVGRYSKHPDVPDFEKLSGIPLYREVDPVYGYTERPSYDSIAEYAACLIANGFEFSKAKEQDNDTQFTFKKQDTTVQFGYQERNRERYFLITILDGNVDGTSSAQQASAVSETRNGTRTVMYADYPDVPDFGALFNAKPFYSNFDGRVASYAYMLEDIGIENGRSTTEYNSLLISCGFNTTGAFSDSNGDPVLEYRNNKHTVAWGLSSDGYVLVIIKDAF